MTDGLIISISTIIAAIISSIGAVIAAGVRSPTRQHQVGAPSLRSLIIGIVISTIFGSFIGIVVGTLLAPKSVVFVEQNGQVVMEAEHYNDQISGSGEASGIVWRQVSVFQDSAGGLAMQTISETSVNTGLEMFGPALLYTIKFQTPGDYRVFVRGYGPSTDSDSVHVGLAGTSVTGNDGIGLSFELNRFSWHNERYGLPTVINVPQPGIYTFYLWMRESGTVIDRIWLSQRTDAVSDNNTSQGPVESIRQAMGQ